MCRRIPERIRIEICISARSSKPARDNVSILASVVVSLDWSATNRLDVWVLASHIEYISFSRRKESSEISEYMEMNSPISMIFSANDTLSSQRSKQVHNCPIIKVGSCLGVGEEDIAPILEVKTWHVPNRKCPLETNIIQRTKGQGTPSDYKYEQVPSVPTRYHDSLLLPHGLPLHGQLQKCLASHGHPTAASEGATPEKVTVVQA